MSILLVIALFLLRSMTKLEKEIINLTQYTTLIDMHNELVNKRNNLKRYSEQKGIDIRNLDDITVAYIYTTGMLDGIHESLVVSEKIAEEIIF